MRVKERLQHGFTAVGIVVSIVVTMLPGMSPAQVVKVSEPYEAVETNPSNGVQTTEPDSFQAAAAELSQLDRMFLHARQAIAYGDVRTAERVLEQVAMHPDQNRSLAQSVGAIEGLIAQQNELAQLASQRHPDYNEQAASFLMQQAASLLKFQDFKTAEMLVSQARKFPVDFQTMTNSPDQVLAAIDRIRKGETRDLKPATDLQMVHAKITEALSLMSQAEFAFDKGELDLAKSLTMQAKQLGVADTQLPANQMLPWQLELKIQDAMKSAGKVIAANFENSNVDGVIQADYYPENDTTHNVPATATAHAGVEPGTVSIPEFIPIPSKAMQLYESGMNAVKSGDRAGARGFFQLAWQERDQLDETTQQSIQDQLSTATESMETEVQEIPDTNSASQPDEQLPGTSETQSDPATDSEQEKKFSRLQSEVFSQRAAAERIRNDDPRQAIETLTQMRNKITQADLSDESKRPLLNFVDRDIAEFQQFLEKNLSDIQLNEDNSVRLASVNETREKRYNAELQIQKLVEEFNDLMDQQRYPEARSVAVQAAALSPDSEIASLLLEKSAFAINVARGEETQENKGRAFVDILNNVDEDSIINVDEKSPVKFGDIDEYSKRARSRADWLSEQQYRSPAERQIWNLLKNEKVQGHYQGTLSDAINQLSEQSGVNIIFDSIALSAGSVSVESSVDIPIRQPISLESALNVILGTSGLVFIVEDEVVKVTSRDAQRRDVKPKTYYVGDLVTPIQNFSNSLSMNFLTPNGQVGSNGFIGQGGQSVPLLSQSSGTLSAVQMAGAAAAATSPDSALAQQLPGFPGLPNRNPFLIGGGAPQTGNPIYTSTGPQAPGGVTEADFLPLINLIRNTIDPEGWDDTNGDGTLQAFVPNLSLIVSQTQEVQDQIQDLLVQLRELNDVQIVVEVRFVSLSDNFFERIGVDFDFSLNDNSGLNPAAIPEQLNGQPSAAVGLTNSDAGPVFTPDLDVQFRQGSFASTAPFFGGFDPASAASFGFAILSDIEVFFLINAAKGDQRTNITQAPTVTMFNGQVASVNDGAQVPFVTSVTPVVGDFAVAQQPIITLLPEGASLNVQATVSHDRKAVRMTLVPFFSQISEVKQFTFDGSVTTQRASDENLIDDLIDAATGDDDNDDNNTGTEIETRTQGVTVQLPTLAFTTVSTVVSVPDGGTILIGGVKRQTEQRVERGVPFLSNIPYVSRLFKNVGIGRETSSLMMMVTPRIIIQEEEEEDQVGSFSN